MTRGLGGKWRIFVDEEKGRVVTMNESEYWGRTFSGAIQFGHDPGFVEFEGGVRRLNGRRWGESGDVRFSRFSR